MTIWGARLQQVEGAHDEAMTFIRRCATLLPSPTAGTSPGSRPTSTVCLP